MGRGKRVTLDEPWQRRVRDRAVWLSEYGCWFDPRTLPRREYLAHMAILEGMARQRDEEIRKAKNK